MKRPPPIHPLLFSLFPVLFLYAQNADEMKLVDLLLPLLLVGLTAVLLTSVVSLITRNARKGALISSVIMLLFLSYGHAVDWISHDSVKIAESVLGPSLTVIIISVTLIILTVIYTVRTRSDLIKLTKYANLFALALVSIQLLQGGFKLIRRGDVGIGRELAIAAAGPIERRPDIFYIIVDGYGRADILQEIYDYDNSAFLSRLHELGFRVADSSCANYPQTLLSLGTALNLDYIENLGRFESSANDRMPLAKKFQRNVVLKFLDELGYTSVAFSSGYSMTELKSADMYIAKGRAYSEFQSILLATTPLPLFAEAAREGPHARHRSRIITTLDTLSMLSEIESPKFVFAHIIAPHPPFVFDAEGGEIGPEGRWSIRDGSHLVKDSTDLKEYIEGYRDQITFITVRLEETIREILRTAGDEPPIIIVQSDHGPGSGLSWGNWRKTNLRERLSIFNAYYLPGLDRDPIYDEITPVNTFRIVFNEYFGTNLRLLPDKHFYAPWSHPFAYIPVTKELGGGTYAHLMEQLLSSPPDSVHFKQMSERKPPGTAFNATGNRLVTEAGVCIYFDTVQRSSAVEIGRDNNDDYLLRYFRQDEEIASQMVPSRWRLGGGIIIDIVDTPQEAAAEGFDRIVVTGQGDDGFCALSHLRLLDLNPDEITREMLRLELPSGLELHPDQNLAVNGWNYGDTIILKALYAVPEADSIHFLFAYEARHEIDTNYKIFFHLNTVGENGKFFNHDFPPPNNTGSWKKGSVHRCRKTTPNYGDRLHITTGFFLGKKSLGQPFKAVGSIR
ncbi:MAG: hypothetical protein JSU74_13275 [Candidatus Zixiibacteriota bacterium]|nr:MAG: hypothetical protein JSU74_13275 [candidate division Zixibacteria bacterium]